MRIAPVAKDSRFLDISHRDQVVVLQPDKKDWWRGRVIHVISGARGSEPSLFQIACIDTGVIRTVNADLVTRRIESKPPEQDQPSHFSSIF